MSNRIIEVEMLVRKSEVTTVIKCMLSNILTDVQALVGESKVITLS